MGLHLVELLARALLAQLLVSRCQLVSEG